MTLLKHLVSRIDSEYYSRNAIDWNENLHFQTIDT